MMTAPPTFNLHVEKRHLSASVGNLIHTIISLTVFLPALQETYSSIFVPSFPKEASGSLFSL